MIHRTLLFLGVFFVLLLSSSPDAGPMESQPQQASSLQDLGWLAGYWTAETEESLTEELWLPPKGGVMLGLHRDLFPSGKMFFEYLRIEETADGIVYQASPRGNVPTPFPLKESDTQRVVFENPAHDFPQRIIYWGEGSDLLHARVEGAPGTKSEEWVWRRAQSF